MAGIQASPEALALRELIVDLLERHPGMTCRELRTEINERMTADTKMLHTAFKVLARDRIIYAVGDTVGRKHQYFVCDGTPIVRRVPAVSIKLGLGWPRSTSVMGWMTQQLMGAT